MGRGRFSGFHQRACHGPFHPSHLTPSTLRAPRNSLVRMGWRRIVECVGGRECLSETGQVNCRRTGEETGDRSSELSGRIRPGCRSANPGIGKFVLTESSETNQIATCKAPKRINQTKLISSSNCYYADSNDGRSVCLCIEIDRRQAISGMLGTVSRRG